MDPTTVQNDVNAVKGVAETILETLEAVDPAVAAPAETAEKLTELIGGLVTAALTALSNATGTPITAESVAALLPNATPLSPPPVQA